MGKHNKPRNVGRTALVIGAAPIALLIANATSAGATTTDIPGGTYTTHLNHGSDQSTDSASGVSTSKEFLDGFLAAKNAQSKTVPLGEDNTATAAQSVDTENSVKAGHESGIGSEGTKSSEYADGYIAGMLDHAFAGNYGDFVAAHQDSTATRGDLHAAGDSSAGKDDAADATGTQTGSLSGTTSRSETLGDGNNYVNSGSTNELSDSTDVGHVLSFDPKTRSADVAKSVRNSVAGSADNDNTVQYGPDSSVATTHQGDVTSDTDSADVLHADKDGNLLATSEKNGTISGTHAIGAAAQAGDLYNGALGDVTTVNGSTGSDRALAFSPQSGLLSTAELTKDQSIDHAYTGELKLGALNGNVASKQSLQASGALRNTSGVTPDQQSDSVSTLDRAVSGSDDSTAGLGVDKVAGVQLSAKTDGSYSGSSTVTAHNGSVSKPENTARYGAAHSNNVHVQLGEQSSDNGVDINLPPLSITPHSG